MEPQPVPADWNRAEEYADAAQLPLSDVIELLQAGALNGWRVDGGWFVAPPLVVLAYPKASEHTAAWLRISACKLGTYLTAGRGEVGILLNADDPGRDAALRDIDAALKTTPELPVAIRLNGEDFLVDSSLWVDLAATLVEFDVLMNPWSYPLPGDGRVAT